MVATLPLPQPGVPLMYDTGKPTQPGYEFLQRLEAMVRQLNAAANAPAAAQYVTIATDATLTQERVLTAGASITLTDAGAGSTLTIAWSPPAGAVLQTLETEYTTNADLTTTIPFDDTTPTNTEGTSVLSQAITPATTSNKVRVTAALNGSVATANDTLTAALFRGSTCIDVKAVTIGTAGFLAQIGFDVLDAPASASAQTYSVRVGGGSGTVRLNGRHDGRKYGGTAKCTLTVQEIKG